MRTLSPAFAAATAGGATTLARCWKLTRRDGVSMGFTDHDRDLEFGGVRYAAGSGVEGSEVESHFSFAVGGGEIAGALASEGLAESDLAKGLWDGAEVELIMVDWSNVEARAAIDTGLIGEVRRHGASFVAEMRSQAARLDEEKGRLFSATCAAKFGDGRCRIVSSLPQWRAQATVDAVLGGALVRAGGINGYASGLFRAGSLVWMSGANAGHAQDVRDHRATGDGATLALWSAPPSPVAVGDAFAVTAGCDKRFSTCRDRFSNAANFRGFPHMPGNDLVMRVAREGEANMDGGSLFK